MNKITDRLWISDAPATRELPADHQFEYVLSLGYFDRLGYDCPAASDTADRFVFPDTPAHEFTQFAAAVDHLREQLADPSLCPVLVHCQAGISRSAAVCAAALAVEQGIPFDAALQQVEDARPEVDPISALRHSARRYVDERVGAN